MSAAQDQEHHLAALDLGSNSFHLIVVNAAHGRIQIIDKHKEMVRLAAGLGDNNVLNDETMHRALECLKRFGQRLRSIKPENLRIIGTNTLRKAANSKQFIQHAEKALGHKIEIVSGREEARLIFAGVSHDLGTQDSRRLVVDIGGGSTELILGQNATPEELESLYMGCVSMSQQCFPNGQITEKNMEMAIRAALVELEPVVAEFINIGWTTCIGASGTINAIAEVIRLSTEEEHITQAGLQQVQEKIIEAGHADKLDLPGLAAERKPVFAGGVATLSAVFDALSVKSMSAAQTALREGVIYDLLGRKQHNDARPRTVQSLIKRYRVDEPHAQQVKNTALHLLDEVSKDWTLNSTEGRDLLTWAALLHEIGMDIAHSGFHKHGAYILAHMDMPGFSRSEQEQLAFLVRTHRRKLSGVPLERTDATELLRLSILLRIAVLLHRNRSHESLAKPKLRAKENQLTLKLPENWLEHHPLTVVDLQQEAKYLTALDIDLILEPR